MSTLSLDFMYGGGGFTWVPNDSKSCPKKSPQNASKALILPKGKISLGPGPKPTHELEECTRRGPYVLVTLNRNGRRTLKIKKLRLAL